MKLPEAQPRQLAQYFISPDTAGVIQSKANELDVSPSEALTVIIGQFALRHSESGSEGKLQASTLEDAQETLGHSEGLLDEAGELARDSRITSPIDEAIRKIGIANGLLDDLVLKMRRVSL